jgi:Flp pilus assembly protein TadD
MSHRPRLAIGALVAALTLVALAPVLRNDFVNFDDQLYVTANPTVQRGLTAANVRWALTATVAGNWHPLTWVSHMLDCQLFGTAPAGHHATSLLLHVVNAVTLFLVLESATGALWPSAVAAALFGVHPLHVESVAWIAERKDVLSTLFMFLGLGAYVAWTRKGGMARYAAVAACLAFGLMAKPMLVTFPIVLLLFDYWPLERRDRGLLRLVAEKLPLVALTLGDAALTIVAQGAAGAVRTTTGLPPGTRLANAVVAYASYLWKMLWPADLICFYPYPTAFAGWRVALAIVVLAGLSVFALATARRRPYLIVGWLWYLVTLIPTIGLVQVGHQSMADRYTYVPLIGIFLAASFTLADIIARYRVAPWLVATAATMVLAACILTTRAQAAYWQTSLTLFTHALAVTPDNYMAHEKLGEALVDAGRRDEGIEHFRETIRLTPTFAEAHVALADALLEHDPASAAEHYGDAVALKPEEATNHAKLGNALWHAGDVDGARLHFTEAVRLAPDDAESLSNLGVVLLAAGARDEAIERLTAAASLDPKSAAAHNNLGFGLAATGRLDDAARELREAIRLEPGLARAHFNLGNVLVTTGQRDEAVAEFERVLAIEPDNAEAHNNLGVTLERLGRTDEARAHYREALRLRPDYGSAATNIERLGEGG